jgi:hypothetical protein
MYRNFDSPTVVYDINRSRKRLRKEDVKKNK